MPKNVPKKAAVQPQPTTTAEQPKPVVEAQKPAAQPEAKKEEKLTKQTKVVAELLAAMKTAGLEASQKNDGKYIVISVASWGPMPTIVVGASGGLAIPEVKSYSRADVATMLKAKEMFDRQQARAEKKAIAATAAPAPAKETVQPEQKKAESTTQKRARQDAQIEAQLGA